MKAFTSLESYRIFWQRPAIFVVLLVIATIAGCVISPRRVVDNTGPTPSPTNSPTPVGTPTPTPGGVPTPSATPAPTATPSPMAAGITVHPQFVFVAVSAAASGASSGSISGFKVEPDGSLSPLPQGATLSQPAKNMFALNSSLAVVGKSSVSLFAVEPATGALRLRDAASLGPIRHAVPDVSGNSLLITTQTYEQVLLQVREGRLIANAPGASAARGTMALLNPSAQQTSSAVLTRDQHFMYVLDRSTAQIKAFLVEGKQPSPLTPASYPVSKGASALVLVSP